MNTHFEITHAIEKQSEEYFSRRVGLYAQTGGVFQPDSREIYEIVHIHRLCAILKRAPMLENQLAI